jgi:hypothetical protein
VDHGPNVDCALRRLPLPEHHSQSVSDHSLISSQIPVLQLMILLLYKSMTVAKYLWNGEQNMNMIRREMPFNHLAFFCAAKSRNISPRYFLRSSNIASLRYFGTHTM